MFGAVSVLRGLGGCTRKYVQPLSSVNFEARQSIDKNASGCIRKGDTRGAWNCDGRQGNRESVVVKLPLIGVCSEASISITRVT